MDGATATASSEDILNLLNESKVFFTQAPEASRLKLAARTLQDARVREEEILKQGAKALIHALATSTDEEQEHITREIRELEDQCARYENELDHLQVEAEASVREEKLREEIHELEGRLSDMERDFQQGGGEAQFRRRQGKGSSGTVASGNMKRMLSLFKNITRIRWDLDCDEEETVGAIVDDKENVIKQFRFGPMVDQNGESDQMKLANKIWQAIA